MTSKIIKLFILVCVLSINANANNAQILINKFTQNPKAFTPTELFSMLTFEEAHDLDHGPIIQAIAKQYPEYLADYNNFDSVEAKLLEWEKLYPEIVKLEVYGFSKEMRPLYALKVSDNVELNESAEPELMITSATHGDELITVEVMLAFIDDILKNRNDNPRFETFINQLQTYWIPMVNPDGYYNKRRTAAGVDPNREYPWPEKTDRFPVNCISQLMLFTNQHNFAGSVDIHAHGRMIMYPWAYTYDSIAEADIPAFDDLVKKMAIENNYKTGPISKVIYVAKGSSADYYYWKKGTKAIAVEVGDTKVPPSKNIPKYVAETKEMTFQFLEYFTN